MTTAAADPAPAGVAPRPEGRLFFLDHLRVLAILLVIVLHASITFMAAPPEWWYVLAPQSSWFFTALVLLVDVPLMPALFFIAGFFAYPSLERHGAARFLRQKALRLGLPWVVGTVGLAPLVTYLIPLTRGLARPYLEFWATDFWGLYYQQSVYWFLGILLLFCVGLAGLREGEPRLQNAPRQAERPGRGLFIRFWALTTVWFFVCSVILPADAWTNVVKVFVFQPARLLVYAGYFGLGVYADRRNWFRPGGYQPELSEWGPAAGLTAVLYLGLRWTGPITGVIPLAAQAGLFNAFCLAAVLAATAFCRRFLSQSGRLRASLARNAYAIYYLHPLILYPAAFWSLALPIPIYLDAALLILVTALAAWGLGALSLTRWPGLRDLF